MATSTHDRQGMSTHDDTVWLEPGEHVQLPGPPLRPSDPEPDQLFCECLNSFRLGASPLSAYPMGGDTTSPGWMNMSSPPTQFASQIPYQQLRPLSAPLSGLGAAHAASGQYDSGPRWLVISSISTSLARRPPRCTPCRRTFWGSCSENGPSCTLQASPVPTGPPRQHTLGCRTNQRRPVP